MKATDNDTISKEIKSECHLVNPSCYMRLNLKSLDPETLQMKIKSLSEIFSKVHIMSDGSISQLANWSGLLFLALR